MNGIIWVLEVYYDGDWHSRVAEKRWNNPSLRSFWEQYREDDPGIPLRIKAYARHRNG